MRPIITISVFLAAFALTAPPVRAQESPRYGGTLVFAIPANPGALNSAFAIGGEPEAVGCKMFNALIYLDRDWNPQPELAKSWTISPDGLSYTFKLIETARWHDGKPFTSADVKFTLEEILSKYQPRSRVALANLERVDAPDPHTVIIRFKKPYAPFMHLLTCQHAPILPKHIYEGTDLLKNPHNQDNPIGTGPFRFQSYTRGDNIVMVRNDAYFRPGLPYLDRMVAKIMPDLTSRTLALEAGEVDYIQSLFLLKQEVARLKANPNLQVKQDTDLPGNFLLFFNVDRKPINDKRVRHALAMGLNRRQIVEQAVFGLGAPGKSAIHVGLKWAYNPDVDYDKLFPYDPTRANAALDALGLRRGADGTRFRLNLVYHVAGPGFNAMADIIRNNWGELGVEVKLDPVEQQLVGDKVFTKRDFDTSIQAYTTAGDPSIGITRAYVTTPAPPPPFSNGSGYSNPKLDELFARAAATPFQEERRKAYFEAQRIIAEDLPVLNLVDRTEVDVASAKFRGLWNSMEPYDEWDRVWWVGGRPSR
jgi:peptide/nickel transport system substrate-binding protein